MSEKTILISSSNPIGCQQINKMKKLYLKELIEKLKLRLDSYSFNELKAIILEYAERFPPNDRQSFLDIFIPVKKTTTQKTPKPNNTIDFSVFPVYGYRKMSSSNYKNDKYYKKKSMLIIHCCPARNPPDSISIDRNISL